MPRKGLFDPTWLAIQEWRWQLIPREKGGLAHFRRLRVQQKLFTMALETDAYFK